MTQKIYFDDGSVLDITLVKPEKETMALIAYRKLTDYIEEELLTDPKLKLLEGEAGLVNEEESLDDLSLDEEDLEDLDDLEELEDDWDDEEEFDDEWLEEEYSDEWVTNS
jgi:hypothetical protein